MAIKQRPGLPLRYFVVEQTGLVKTFQTGDTKAEVALDLTSVVYAGFEPGLLQLEFHRLRPEAYVVYTRKTATPGLRALWTLALLRCSRAVIICLTATVKRFCCRWARSAMNTTAAVPCLVPMVCLYVAVGDDNDVPHLNAQDPTTLFGKFLRLDIDSRPTAGDGLRHSTDNPFASGVEAR